MWGLLRHVFSRAHIHDVIGTKGGKATIINFSIVSNSVVTNVDFSRALINDSAPFQLASSLPHRAPTAIGQNMDNVSRIPVCRRMDTSTRTVLRRWPPSGGSFGDSGMHTILKKRSCRGDLSSTSRIEGLKEEVMRDIRGTGNTFGIRRLQLPCNSSRFLSLFLNIGGARRLLRLPLHRRVLQLLRLDSPSISLHKTCCAATCYAHWN